MANKLQELNDKRNVAIKAARDLHDEWSAKDEPIPGDIRAQWDAYIEEAKQLKDEMEMERRQQEAEAFSMADLQGEIKRDQPKTGPKIDPEPDEKPEPYVHEYRDYRFEFTPGDVYHSRAQDDYRAAYDHYLRTGNATQLQSEYRALQADSDQAGGYTVPTQFLARLIQAVDDAAYIRQWSTVIPLPTGSSLGAPSLETDPADADWTAELLTGNADTAMDFGKRELTPHPLAKRLLVSNKLLRSSALNIESLVAERLGYKFGITEEKGFLTGTGSNQPLGVFTASSDGISTSRDVSSGNTTTSIQFDGLKSAKYELKPQYRNGMSSRWLFHRDAVEQIAKLKDGEGRYIWQQSTVATDPDTLLGIPMFESEYAPNTFTTGLYVGILGDFSNYWIVDSLMMSMQRLVELYAATNQTGFIGRLETDGMPVLEEAFVRVTLA